MYDDEEDQQNSERSDNPDEIGSDPSMLVLSPQKVHTGWRTVVVPWQDQSLSLEFFGVPLPPTPTTAIRIERFSFFYLGRSIRFRLLSHIPELALTVSPPINFLSLRDLGRIDISFDFGILRNLPCLTHLTFLLSRPELMSHIDVSHIIPRSHIHARKPYLVFWFFDFFLSFCDYFYLAQPVYQAGGEAEGLEEMELGEFLCHDTLRDMVKFLCYDDFEIGDLSENVGSPNDLIYLSPTTETLEGRIEPTWPEYQSSNPALEQHRAILPHTVPHVMTRSNVVTVTTLQLETDKSSRLSPRCLLGSITQDDDFEIGHGIYKFLCDNDFEIGDLNENVRSPNYLICLSPTTETLEGCIEPTWPEYQSANPALEQHRAILPHTVPQVITRNDAVTITTLQMETDKSSLLSPQCLSGSITQENLALSCPVPTLVTREGCFLEEDRSINSSIELPCSNPALKLPTVTTTQGSVEEERYVKIINPSIEIPQLAGPALQPEAFPNLGKSMQLDSSEQESSVRFDATNIGGNVVSANKNFTTTCSQKKITITELLPLIGLTREAAAGKIGVSIPTFKRHCRLNNIIRWPDYRNKNKCLSLQRKLAADSDQGAAGAFGHFVTGSHTGAVGSNHHNSPCSKPPKRQRGKKTSPSCKTPSIVATCSDPAPMQAMSTFPQIMPHLRAGQGARIEISKTTEDIPIQSVQGLTTRSFLSPQERAGSDVPSTSSPKHFHCISSVSISN